MNSAHFINRIHTVAFLIGIAVSGTVRAEVPESFPPTATFAAVKRLVADFRAPHPRLMTNAEELARLAENVNGDPTKRLIADEILRKATITLKEPPVKRELIGIRLLSTSRLCLERVLTLSLAYHLTGDERFAKRCQAEMLSVADFSDWGPAHFLDVAEMTLAMAIGYDWLFDQLDPSVRDAIRTAIVSKGLELQFNSSNRGWVRKNNNWGQVCHGGMVAGAIAVVDSHPELAARTIHSAVHNVVPAMEQYAPRGSYPEGPHYWSYGTSFNIILIDALEHAFATDFGLSAAPGFAETGSFVSLVCGPSGEYFNYSDGGADREPQVSLPWLAERFDRPEWLAGEHERWQRALGLNGQVRFEAIRHFPLYLIWATRDRAEVENGSHSITMPLHWSSGGAMPIAVHRSAWGNPRASFVGLKGGSPSASHGHMDCGSFVLESDGVRWAIDLGREDYQAIESQGLAAWKFDQNSDRWKILKYNNFGHNTLTIDNQLQQATGNAAIVRFSDEPAWPYSVVDLTEVYEPQITSARRGISLLPSGHILFRDELKGLKPGTEVTWSMLTRATARAEGSTVTLDQSGESLRLISINPPELRWQLTEMSQPPNPWDSPNPGCSKLELVGNAPPSGELTITVVAMPGSCTEPVPNSMSARPLDSWGGTQE